ncbi:sigma-54 dependent transcriptional regulator [Vibrio sp. ZSDE26]|uniref:Sigma-54 dependent transcriptional regulator n=2 Tax=Vibrio amylolyticus TaxID=2847292 RepID=A0A9X1XJQ3_9VIBR|nr:sigma-54 dependent transcriptional regulator [Vibrio amylolyticus]
MLSESGYRCRGVSTAFDALIHLNASPESVLMVSSELPDMSLIEVVEKSKHLNPHSALIAIVDYQQHDLASEAMRAGASDYLLTPYQPMQLMDLLQRVTTVRSSSTDLIASSWRSQQVLQLAHRAAKTDATVLITGESGTGKEVLAQYVHQHSQRSEGPFVAINCAAIPETMLEAVLFGHVKGAFTGATAAQAGKFEEANGGTLLLDEIGEIPLAVQAKLLRVLQEREVERLGSHKSIALDVRIIAATNVNLQEAVSQRLFRQDLYYRLDVLPLQWPPLRERKEDVLPLAKHFIAKYNQGCTETCRLSAEAENSLLAYDWVGNIRELENTIQRALVMRHSTWITSQDLMLPTCDSTNSITLTSTSNSQQSHQACYQSGLKDSKKQAENQFILDTLAKFNGRRNLTAEALGITTRALRYKIAAMREQGINVDAVSHYSYSAA